MNIIEDEEGGEIKRTQPRLVTFVQSVMAFKRLARKMKRWRHLEDNRKYSHSRGPSELLLEVKKTMYQVKKASGGYHVIDVTANDIALTRMEIKKNRILKNRERKRAEDEAAHQKERHFDLTDGLAAAQQAMKASSRRRKDKLASRLDDMQVDFDKDLFNKIDASNGVSHSEMNNDVAHMVAKNQQMGKEQKVRIKKDSMSTDKIEYLPGTTIYFGSTVALQARHGGFVSYANANHVKASAHKVLPYARFIVVNCDDPSDTGLLRYGDAIWLQTGPYEVLGAQYLSQKNGAPVGSRKVDEKGADSGSGSNSDGGSKEREIVPALVNSRKENAFKAHQYGRWIILNRDKPLETLGNYVTHMDQCMFEQGWFFLSSHTPYDSSMQRKGSFEEVAAGEIDAFKPGSEAQWSMHLVALPNDQHGGRRQKKKQGAEVKAFEQIEKNYEFRYAKRQSLMGRLEESLPTRLSMDKLMVDELGHKLTHNDRQQHYLKKYFKQSDNHFTTAKHDIHVLANIYGADSFVVQLAKQRQIIHEHELGNTEVEMEMERHLHDRQFQRKPRKEVLLDDYWDKAGKVLLDTRAWGHLKSGMKDYYESDRERKLRAIRVIARFLFRVRTANSGFLQMMLDKDKYSQRELAEDTVEMKMILYQKAGFTTKKSEIDRVVAEQWENQALSKMDEPRASRLRTLSNALKVQQAAVGKEVQAREEKRKEKERKDQKKEIEEMRQLSKLNFSAEGCSATSVSSPSKPKVETPLKAKEELSFRGYDTPLRPSTAPGPLKDPIIMSRLSALPVPKFMSVYTEYEPPSSNNNTFMTEERLPPLDAHIRPGTAPLPKHRTSIEYENKTGGNDLYEDVHGPIFSASPERKDMRDRVDNTRSRFTQNLINSEDTLADNDAKKKLPKDVRRSRKVKVSLSTSISFLRASSKTPGIYDDVKATKRGSSRMSRSKR